MESIITIPGTALADVLEASGVLFTDLWVLLAVAIGLPVAFYVFKRIIGLMPKGR